MNNEEMLKAFIVDFMSEITERKAEAETEMREERSDLFKSGRALAYNEVFEILQNRLDIYDIKIEND
ncbi:MAG: transposase [Ruminococcus sp.]|nr:transposase [Ruminococcus sp.]